MVLNQSALGILAMENDTQSFPMKKQKKMHKKIDE